MVNPSPKETFDELRTMVTDYARQETLDPLKRLYRWVKFGFAGATLMSAGAFLLGLGLLRLFQTMDWAESNWSFAPYMLVFSVLLAVAGLCFKAMTTRPDWLDELGEEKR